MFSIFCAEGSLGEVISEGMNPAYVNIFGLEVGPSVVTGMITTFVLVLFAIVVRIFFIPRFKDVPGTFQLLLETIYNLFDGIAKENSHTAKKSLSPYLFAAGLFICVGTLIELLGFRPVFADINACIAMAICSFALINFYGFKKNGLIGRFTSYFRKSGIAGPFLMLSDLMVPVSLTLRLYGSILSGYLIMELVYSIMALRFVVPALLSVIFTLLHAFIQAYIFTLLTAIFIGEAIE